MHNGQGSGSTETGAYTLSGNTGIITKNVGATVWIPSEAEWYKAAYYDPTLSGGTGGYWEFQTQSNITPTVAAADVNGDITNSGANVVNYLSGADWNAQDGNVTTVGSAAASSYFGTFDQGGNVSEWNDLVAGSDRGIRGGSYDGFGTYYLNARGESFPSNEHSSIGFRLASAIPESTTGLLAILGLFPLFSRRRKA